MNPLSLTPIPTFCDAERKVLQSLIRKGHGVYRNMNWCATSDIPPTEPTNQHVRIHLATITELAEFIILRALCFSLVFHSLHFSCYVEVDHARLY